MNHASKYLTAFFSEKSLDREEIFEVVAPLGTVNFIPAGVVMDTILLAPQSEQEKIASILQRMDFHNAEISHFLRHLAGAIAYDF